MTTRIMLVLLSTCVLLLFPGVAGGELEPSILSPAGAEASSPRIASDGAGNVVAAWRQVDGEQSSIRAAFRPRGGTWRELSQLSAPAASTESPEIAMDRLGNAVAVWHRSSARDSVVQAAIRPAGGTWSAPEDLSAPSDVAFNADVALEAGRAVAVWTVMRERRSVVQSSSRTIPGPWSPPETLSAPVGNSYAPVVAMGDGGAAVAAWQWTDGAFLVVQAASRTNAGDWSAPEVLSGPGRHASRPVVAMDASGNALVGWVRYNGSWLAAQVARRAAGQNWEPPQNLSARGGNAAGLDLAMNRRGDAVATWGQSGVVAAIGHVWSALRPAAAQGWTRLPVAEVWRGLNARTAIDEVGNATVVWSGSMSISASFKPLGQAWQPNYLLSRFQFANAQPAVTTQAPREASAVWIAANASDDRIHSVFYDVDTAKEEADDDEGDEEGDEEEEDEETEEGETFSGTPKADTLVGTPGNDVFYGYGGNDAIDGRGGRDVIYGGPGRDRIAGGRGADKLFGGTGADRVIGGRGRDVLTGGAGSDTLDGGSGSDVFYGSRGNDQIAGRGGRDLVYGGLGDDRIAGGDGVDELFGGADDDRIAGGRGSDRLTGGYGRDILSGNSGNDTLRALDRVADHAFGGSGLDVYSLDRWLDRAQSIESRAPAPKG
jgi:Ca2+-binding RTX toxin-like protein